MEEFITVLESNIVAIKEMMTELGVDMGQKA